MRIVKIPLINWCHKDSCTTDKTNEQIKEAVEYARSNQIAGIVKKPAPSSEVSEKVMTKEEHQRKVDELIDKVRKEVYESAKMHFDAEKKEWTKDKPKDWAFMEQSGKVLKDYPATWMQYPNTVEGVRAIVEMEYGEVMAACRDQLGAEAVSHELVHLASACLLMWRKLNHAE